MTVEGETGGIGTKAISRSYPNTTGLTAGTTKQEGRKPHLEAQDQDLTTDKEGL